jgi:hypothetical protein
MPHSWTSTILLAVANQFGPLPNAQSKFDVAGIPVVDLHDINHNVHHYSHTAEPKNEKECISLPEFGIGNSLGGNTSYGFRSHACSVNWTTLIHKSMQLYERQR